MNIFLTSSPTGSLDGRYKVHGLDENNQFRQNLKSVWKDKSKVAYLCADFKSHEQNEQACQFFYHMCQISGLSISSIECIDDRYKKSWDFDVIFIGGGHVPTQNYYFHQFHIREKMKNFNGIVIGISAGSMNCAKEVYAMPELQGESKQIRFFKGLNLTKTQIIPHYQMLKDSILDGKKLFDDWVYMDSINHEFIVLVDGSYIWIQNQVETIFGLAYQIKNGKIKKICDQNECVVYKESAVL
ncbi:Type 1 glutamine amidotransferase-like domain-containing protein [Floccifex sp.]|uniref:Type 1 glutamine amidotransferase-like domain-containing protein n=1 Tax=Floccifex sp. TaxID=2815810 RepID=UPI003F047D94